MFFDSHAHFDHVTDDSELSDLLQRARAAGVERIVAIGGHEAANQPAVALARAQPDLVRAAVG